MHNAFHLLRAIFQMLWAIAGALYYYSRAVYLAILPRQYRRRNIEGDIVLITGGGSGIGRNVAIRLADRGAKIVSWDINDKGNDETKKIIESKGGKCYVYTVNICNRSQIYQTANLVKLEVGKVDILINNAGVVSGNNLLECSDEDIIRTFDVNILSHFWTVKAFLPDMLTSNKGHIVTISSIAGIVGSNKLVDYSASKFAAVGFDEALRMELNAENYKGINTTLVCPYYIDTGMFKGVKSRLVYILKPDYVSGEIADAVLMNERHLVMPFFLRFILRFKGLMPAVSQMKVFNAITGDQALNNLRTNNNLKV